MSNVIKRWPSKMVTSFLNLSIELAMGHEDY